MQADRFTVKSQEAVAAAQRLAGQRRNPEVTPAHLLLTLLDQEDGLVVPVLNKLSADVASIRSRTERAVGDLPTVGGPEEPEARPASSFLKVLQRAETEMAALTDEYISTEHLLLALSDRSSGVSELLPDRRVAEQGDHGGPGTAPRHLPESRGDVPGARASTGAT